MKQGENRKEYIQRNYCVPVIVSDDFPVDWGQEEKGTTEDEMARWDHQLNGHEFE